MASSFSEHEPSPVSLSEAALYLRRMHRPILCAVLLLPLFASIYFLSFRLRFEGAIPPAQFTTMLRTIGWVLVIKLFAFGWFRVYQGWSRYVTFHDLVVLFQAATASSLALVLADYLIFPSLGINPIPRSVLLMDWGGSIFAIGGLRAFSRLLRERGRLAVFSSGRTPVFIIGANDHGETILRSIRANQSLRYDVVGFIDDRHASHPFRIGGVEVIGTLDETCKLAEQFGVHEVLIAAGELSGRQVRTLMQEGRAQNVRVTVLPSFEQMLAGSVALRPRSVSIEDLLRREPVEIDTASIGNWLDGKTVMVTGSAGSIGSEICRQLLLLKPRKIVLVDRSENGQFFLERELERLPSETIIETTIADIDDQQRLRTLFGKHRPQIVFHAAAYKHVPLMEANPGEAVKNIVLATQSLADLADEFGVESFVMISTDKAVNPSSVMGACKRLAELYVQSLSHSSETRFVTVRFGNVLDSAGSVVPVFRQQIDAGGPVTITDPRIKRYFMTIPEASQLVIQSGAIGWGGEIFVLDMGDPVRIVDLAKDMIRLSGMQVGKDIELEFIGLRPGEKLTERLSSDVEVTLPTQHPKINMVKGDTRNREDVLEDIQQLSLRLDGPNEAVIAELQAIIPEFVRNSGGFQTPPAGRTGASYDRQLNEPSTPAPMLRQDRQQPSDHSVDTSDPS